VLGEERAEERRDRARAEWDARYSGHEAMWSGSPNGRLIADVAGLSPGRALDVGCGEGADAVWLAQRGWVVIALDISLVALDRGRRAAERGRVAVTWVCGDALRHPFPAGAFDLVSMQYPALPKAAGEAAVRSLLQTVRSGGSLFIVSHDLDDDHRRRMKSHGTDPANFVDADDFRRVLDGDFTIQRDATEPRIDPPPGKPPLDDVVLLARRR
jgi:SAM-dependent methyltransferase